MNAKKTFVIYEIETTRFLRIVRNGYWQNAKASSEGRARLMLKREAAKRDLDVKAYAIAEASEHAKIEKQETKKNLISGAEFTQSVNTPTCCDPSSETYWSM
jgi:hypothetical protein